MNAIEHLEHNLWCRPSHYFGFSPDGDSVVLTRHRDSELLDRVNWEVACEELHAQAYDDGERCAASRPPVYHFRANHFLIGWVEYLLVRADAPDSIKQVAGEVICALADYPILSDEKYSAAQSEAVAGYWQRCSVCERIHEIQHANKHVRSGSGISIFAARRDEIPEDPDGRLNQQLVQSIQERP